MTDFKPYPKEKSTITAKEYREQRFKYSKKKSKYNNQSVWYDGNKYDSKLECKYAQDLDYRVKINEVERWERQVKLDLKVNGIHITNYYIDFKVFYPDGGIEYVEVKGLEMRDWKLKWSLLQATRDEVLEPGAELLIVKA